MASLTYPAVAGHLDAFVARVKVSPKSTVNAAWLQQHAHVKGKGNAATTLGWLKTAGFIDEEGHLTHDLGDALLAPDDSDEFKAAMKEATSRVLGAEVFTTLATSIPSDEVESYLIRTFKVGTAVAGKARRGLAALARKSGDPELIRCFPAADPSQRRTATKEARERKPAKASSPAPSARKPSPPVETPPTPVQRALSPILSGSLVQFHVDGTWKIEDIRELISVLQAVERGEKIDSQQPSLPTD